MKFDFPQVDLPNEIVAWTDVTEDILNIYQQSCRLKAGVFAICIEGNIKASINLVDYEIKQNDLITLLPGSILQLYEKTDKVRLAFVGFSSGCISRINLIKILMGVFQKISEQPVLPLQEDIAGYFFDYFALLSRLAGNKKLLIDPEMAEASLQSVLAGIRMSYKTYSQKERISTRKEEICKELVQAVTEHYTTERRAQFYANKLGVSLQHLSTTVKQATGKNVLDIIAYIVIMDAKAKLKSTHMTIQEVAFSLNFASASFFGKYFRRYVGMTPLEYRNN
ncbi:MAG: helix-turn-helix domain-containing protein [Bacteroides sp.]